MRSGIPFKNSQRIFAVFQSSRCRPRNVFPWCIRTFTLEVNVHRCTELTLPCFAGPLSALGRAEFRVFQEAGAAALPGQRVPRALGVPGAAASPHPARRGPGPPRHARRLPGRAPQELRVLPLLRDAAPGGPAVGSQGQAAVQGAQQPADSRAQPAAAPQGPAQ